jgi:hypothetical protein
MVAVLLSLPQYQNGNHGSVVRFVGTAWDGAAMNPDDRAVLWLRIQQRGVLSRSQALASGVTPSGLQHRLRRGGPWQKMLPGIYLMATGQPTWEQTQIAALLFAGPGSVITGPAALQTYKIKVPDCHRVDVLVPIERKRASCSYAVLHRTTRMPLSVQCDGPLRFAPAARAVADAVRSLGGLAEARAAVASAVQQRRCTVDELVVEARDGPIRGSARLRAILAEVIDGIRSVPEGDFRVLIKRSGLPMPLFNAVLYLNGQFLASPDAWWPSCGVAVEIDSREWHLLPADWEQTMRRHARMAAAGIRVIHVTPHQLRTEPERILADIAAALRTGRAVPDVTTRPAETVGAAS